MKPVTRRRLIERVDRAFSRYIRQRHAVGGWVDCVTCGVRLPWEDSDAGHFVRRGHAAVRWHPKNVHPQCTRCNRYLGGAMDEHAAYIIKTYGVETLDELMALKHTTKKWTMSELRELLETYEEGAWQS